MNSHFWLAPFQLPGRFGDNDIGPGDEEPNEFPQSFIAVGVLGARLFDQKS